MANTETLPRIIQFTGMSDSGEYGNATCPHCGAQGRYVYNFIVEGGERRGAMAGCIQRFPVSQIAKVHKGLLKKAQEYASKGWTLPSWDLAIVEAIEAFGRDEMTEGQCLTIVTNEQNKAKAYRDRKYGKRRSW